MLGFIHHSEIVMVDLNKFMRIGDYVASFLFSVSWFCIYGIKSLHDF